MRTRPPAHHAPTASESETRTTLLDAAARRYARFGPRKTTMGEVAQEAGYSRATVYKHFANKDALYGALLERSTQAFVDEVSACIAGPGGARTKLRQIVEIAHSVYAQSPVLLGAAAQDDDMRIEAIASDAMRRQESEIVALLARVLEAGVEAGAIREIDPDLVAYLMFQLGQLLVIRELAGRADFPLQKVLDAMDDLIARGLVREPGEAKREIGDPDDDD